MYKTFRDLLIKNHRLSMQDQSIKLESFLSKWMEKEEQVDDIIVMGIKV